MKVYRAHAGMRELLVAADDLPTALAALDLGPDFADCAAETEDPELHAIALGDPGAVFERPVWAWRPVYARRGLDLRRRSDPAPRGRSIG